MSFLFKNVSVKKFLLAKKSSGGRNSMGRTTVHHRALGHKKKYRILDFFKIVRGVVGRIRQLEYDPNRKAYISLVCFQNNILSYFLAPNFIGINDYIITTRNFSLSSHQPGNSTSLLNLSGFDEIKSGGRFLHNIEFFPDHGAKLTRTAGASAQLIKRFNENYFILKLTSKEERLFHKDVYFTYGTVSNEYMKFERLYKAGQSIYRGLRPVVRGEAKNPVDHPHGGNTSGGRHPMTPWGKLTRCVKTRSRKKPSSNMIHKTRYLI
jgi:large subunit ribosomal protein L2